MFQPSIGAAFKEAENVRFIPGATYLGGSYERDPTSQGWVDQNPGTPTMFVFALSSAGEPKR
jgi:hypothetical protein